MHHNPVVGGVVASPEDWRWSSFRSYAYREAANSNHAKSAARPKDHSGMPTSTLTAF